MLNLTDMFPEAPTEVHFSLIAPAAVVDGDPHGHATFHALAISASLLGLRVSVDDFAPDGTARFDATGTGTVAEMVAFGSVALADAERFGMTFTPLMVVNI